MNPLGDLEVMIDRLLAGEWTAAEFEGAFVVYYYEHVPVDVMRSSAASLYSTVLEKLEFTMADPTAADREDGWIDYEDFIRGSESSVNGWATLPRVEVPRFDGYLTDLIRSMRRCCVSSKRRVSSPRTPEAGAAESGRR